MELLLSRLERDSPPDHLADLGIAQIGETFGRERRYKYFTIANYQKLVAQEGLDGTKNHYLETDLSLAGEFMPVDESLFYRSEKDLEAYINSSNGLLQTASGSSKKVKTHKNPMLPDGTIKKGRPRKTDIAAAKLSKKRKRDEEDELIDEQQSRAVEEFDYTPSLKRRRGRPRKNAQPDPAEPEASTSQLVQEGSSTLDERRSRTRGRPSKASKTSETNHSSSHRARPPPSVEADAEYNDQSSIQPSREADRPEDTARLQILSEISAELTSTRSDPTAGSQDQTNMTTTSSLPTVPLFSNTISSGSYAIVDPGPLGDSTVVSHKGYLLCGLPCSSGFACSRPAAHTAPQKLDNRIMPRKELGPVSPSPQPRN